MSICSSISLLLDFEFQAGDLILADKGFVIHELLPRNVILNLPAFLAGKSQLTKSDGILANYDNVVSNQTV